MFADNSIKKHVISKMAALCSRAEQCSPDIRKKIIALGLTNKETDEVLEYLKKEKFIDDERYVEAYVTEKININKWGRVKIRYYLHAKGLFTEIIETGLRSFDEKKYIDILINTMKKKAAKSDGKSKLEKIGQIIRFAQSRGFEPELIHRYINEVIK
ncbi:MAG: RecX family transcriptional regulator [Bacteroidales bacterium]|jgi:regulatory protein|nr:RecX family transcriptional regulator [Bacteroidales bacterium]